MKEFVRFLFSIAFSTARSRLSLQIEIAALRPQLSICQWSVKRPRVRLADRILWSYIAKVARDGRHYWSSLSQGPVTEWQKRRFRDLWLANWCQTTIAA